ncbi:MAG: ferritin family protein [Bacteroidota bacterium]
MFDTSHLHPMLVHFPVALITIGFLADVLSLFFNKKEPCLSKVGFYLMIFGTLGAIAAFFSGEFFTNDFTGVMGELKERHELFAKITMYVMIAACLIRIYLVWKKKSHGVLKWLVFFLYFLATASVGYTGLLGGSLVYNYMIEMQDNGTSTTLDSTKTVNKTVDNLKAAVQGETTASAKYAAFAQKAIEENLNQIASLFNAASKSESIHAANHIKALEAMGQKFEAKADTFTVKTTKENLDAAYNGEKHEVEVMYPAFSDQAKADNANDAIKSITWAMETESKHMELYKAAIDALAANKVKTLPTTYFVCPKCGFTYSIKDVEDYCELCGTPKDKFFVIK